MPYVDIDLPLPHVVTVPVLGLPTHFATNDRAMLEIVDEAFGVWSSLDSSALQDVDERDVVHVRIAVVADDGIDADAPIEHSTLDGLRFVARSSEGIAVSDPAGRRADIRVNRALAADRARFRTEMLEAAVLALLSCYDRHPVHAAAVAQGGHALLFAAPSGTGKSTLAYACHAAGLDLLGDDHVRVQLEPALRVWGWPARVRLLADTAERMGARATVQTMNGKRKAVVDARDGMSAARLVARDVTVCVLSRDGGPLVIDTLSPVHVARALEEQLAPGFDRFPARWPAVASALAARGGWRLNLSADPREALPIVRELLTRSARDA